MSTDVHFLCQRCRQPLKLDASFSNIDQATMLDLTAPICDLNNTMEPVELFSEGTQHQSLSPTYADNAIIKTIPSSLQASTDGTDSANGFTLLGETTAGGAGLSNEVEKIAYLFDVMSGYSEVDHPLCEECADTLLDILDGQLKQSEDECRDYQELLEKLEKASTDDVSEEALDKELQQLKTEEAQLQVELAQVTQEREQVEEALQRETEIATQLEEDEERFYREYNDYKRQMLQLEDDQRSIDAQLKYAQNQLDKLKKTNIFNATFHIWHNGPFGTINNFRLGRLPSIPVEWSEINAAWGQTVLLLYSLAKRMNLVFQRYRLVPNGNHSYIEQLSDKSKDLPLYCAGGIRFFWDTKFDQAMVAFLDCCQQFKDEVERGDSGFCLPYRMESGKIEDTTTKTSFSIKIQFNSEEQWTKALKFMLTNLKWGVAWVSSQYPDT